MDMLHPEVENVICYILVKNLNLIGILSANHIILQFLITIFFCYVHEYWKLNFMNGIL
jgi:hypothetical protein